MTSPPSPTLSAHGAQIPALGFGTSPMTGGLAPDTVVAALKAGYRHIDTAWKYGTERAVGEAMRASGVPRSDIFLTTKVVARISARRRLRQVGGRKPRARSRSTTSICCWCTGPTRRFRSAKPCRRWPRPSGRGWRGTSASRTSTSRCSIRRSSFAPSRWSALQAEYHPYLDQSKLLAAVRQRGMAFIAYCPLGRGRLFSDPVLAEIAKARGTKHRPGRAALADAAERRRHSALVRIRSASPTISRCSISP